MRSFLELGTGDPMIRHPDLDRTFFARIDSPEKAYLLGLLWADGSVDLRTKQVRLRLQESDSEVLLRASELVGGPRPKRIEPSGNAKSRQCSLTWSSAEMVSDLGRLGICPNKDHVLPQAVAIGGDLQRHFSRGLIDGDGCLQFVNRTPRISFRNRNEALRDAVAEALREASGVCPSLDGKKPHRVTGRVYPAIYLSGEAAVKGAKFLYRDGDLAIPRKLATARQFDGWIPSPHRNRFLAGPTTKRIGTSGNCLALVLDAAVASHLCVAKGDIVRIELLEGGSVNISREKNLDPLPST